MAFDLVPVAITPRPFTSAAPTWLEVAAGSTVRAALVQAVNAGALPADDLPRTLAATRIVVDGLTLPRETALDHVLQPGQVAAIDVCGAGGGGGSKDVGQVLLTLAVIAVSAWVGGPAGAGLGLKSAFLRTVASATVMALGQAAVAGLYAPEREAQAKTADRFALQGASNQYRPWAPFPIALGEVVVAPDFAVKTFTKTQGDDVWLHGILGLHYGPCVVSELKIGDTLVSSMGAGDVQVVEHLTPGPRTFTLHPNDVDQLDLQEKLEADTATATPVVRAGSAEGERFEFDFFLPGGLHYQKDDGRRVSASVTLSVRSRPIDENGVPTGGGAWSGATSWTLTSTTKEPWRVTRGISLPLGRYEFDVRRSVRIDMNDKRRDEVAITAIRAIAYRKPIVDETLSLIEFAVRATALNQGTLAPITCRLTPKCPMWDAAAAGGAGAWTAPTPTSNPAALTRWLMTGPAPARPLATSEADARLRTWFALCETHDWTAGIYLTETRSQADVLALLESAGRAGVFWDGAQLAAAPWVEKPAPRQLFAGANLRNHRWQILYPEPVHALRVEFQNLDEGGAPDELYVYADGYAETAGPGVEAATLIEALRLEGQKRPERAYRDGRWALGQRKLQRRIDSWETDVEHLASSYGDRVRLSYGRIEEANPVRVRCRRWSGGSVSGLRLSAPVRFEPGLSYAVDLRRVGGLDAAVPVVNPAVAEVVETREIVFAAARTEATSPKADDLVAFGQTALISEDVELIGVEPAEGLTARLTAMRYVAPELMAGETGPIPDLVSRLTRARMAAPAAPRLLGVQADPQGVRVSFDVPPWAGSPIAGFAARWRPTPAIGQDAGWVALPPLDPTARVLVTPPPRALAAEAGDVEGETRIDVEIRAFTEAGQASPVPLTVSSILVRAEPFAPLGLTVTPATRPAPDGSSHAVLVVALDPLAVAEGVDILLECRRSPVGATPDAWESAGLALDVRNPTGDVLGLRGGERYGFRAALRDGAGWVSAWTAEVFGTVPSGTSTVPREERRRALDLQLADRLTRFESWLTETERRRRVDRDLRDVVDVVIGEVDPVTRTGRMRFGDLYLGETPYTLEGRLTDVDLFADLTRTDLDDLTLGLDSGLVVPGAVSDLVADLGGLAYRDAVFWSDDVLGRPIELTDGRIAEGFDATGTIRRPIPPLVRQVSDIVGYDELGDFDGSDTVGFDPMTPTSPTETVAAVLRRYSLHPEQEGAVGDGIANDAVAIQRALDTGRDVRLTTGKTYRITAGLVMNHSHQRLYGLGQIKAVGSFDIITVTGGVVGVEVDVVVHSPDHVGGYALKVVNAERTKVRAYLVNAFGGLFVQKANVVSVEWLYGSLRGPGITWKGDKDNRSDLLMLKEVYLGLYGPGDQYGLDWDGNCHSLEIKLLTIVNAAELAGQRRAMVIRNTAHVAAPGAGHPHPIIARIDHIEIDYAYGHAIEFQVPAHDVDIVAPYIHAANGGSAIKLSATGTGEGGLRIHGGMMDSNSRYAIENAGTSPVYMVNTQMFLNGLGSTLGPVMARTPRVNWDDQFYALVDGGNPLIGYDTNDYQLFSRGSDFWEWVLGSTRRGLLDVDGFQSAKFRLDADAYLSLSGGNPILNFAPNDTLGYSRTGDRLFLNIGGVERFAVTAADGAVVPRLTLGTDAYLALSSGTVILNADATDYLDFHRASNTWAMVVGGTQRFTVSASVAAFSVFLQASQGLQVDASFTMTISSGKPRLTFDATDYIEFDRTLNRWTFAVGGVSRLTVDGSTLVSVGDFSAPKLGVDANFFLGLSGLNPTVRFDTGDELVFNRSTDALQVNIGGTTRATFTATSLNLAVPLKHPARTVGELPAGESGMRDFVTDATAPAWGAAVVGGGAVRTPVFHDGAGWKVG